MKALLLLLPVLMVTGVVAVTTAPPREKLLVRGFSEWLGFYYQNQKVFQKCDGSWEDVRNSDRIEDTPDRCQGAGPGPTPFHISGLAMRIESRGGVRGISQAVFVRGGGEGGVEILIPRVIRTNVTAGQVGSRIQIKGVEYLGNRYALEIRGANDL